MSKVWYFSHAKRRALSELCHAFGEPQSKKAPLSIRSSQAWESAFCCRYLGSPRSTQGTTTTAHIRDPHPTAVMTLLFLKAMEVLKKKNLKVNLGEMLWLKMGQDLDAPLLTLKAAPPGNPKWSATFPWAFSVLKDFPVPIFLSQHIPRLHWKRLPVQKNKARGSHCGSEG